MQRRLCAGGVVACLALASAVAVRAEPPKELGLLAESGYEAFFSPDGKYLALKSDLFKLGVLQVSRAGARTLWGGDLRFAAFTGDSKVLVASSPDGKTLHFVNVVTGRALRSVAVSLPRKNSSVDRVAVSGDGKRVAMTVLLGPAQVVDAATGRSLVELDQCTAYRLTFTPGDTHLVGHDGNGQFGLWDAATGRPSKLWKICERGIEHCVYSGDFQLAAAGESDTGIVYLWDMSRGEEIGRLQNLKFIKALAMTRDGKTLAVSCVEPGSQPTVKLWDLASQTELEGPGDFPARVLSLTFSPDGKLLAAAQESNIFKQVPAATRLYAMPQ